MQHYTNTAVSYDIAHKIGDYANKNDSILKISNKNTDWFEFIQKKRIY